MQTEAVKAAAIAVISQALTLLVGYGIISNQHVGEWSALSMGAVNVAFLIAHAWHAQTAAKHAAPPTSEAPK